mmetsp:Transcript_43924/g.114237  ORF Transcript_43924/g.114237 Transcript_43924/m.114237 type:complete len:147 (+) Transcript_43924:223-663(+)
MDTKVCDDTRGPTLYEGGFVHKGEGIPHGLPQLVEKGGHGVERKERGEEGEGGQRQPEARSRKQTGVEEKEEEGNERRRRKQEPGKATAAAVGCKSTRRDSEDIEFATQYRMSRSSMGTCIKGSSSARGWTALPVRARHMRLGALL